MSHTDHTIGNLTVRKLHRPDGSGMFGCLVGLKADDNSLIDPIQFETEFEAERHAYSKTARRVKVDCVNGTDVFKIVALNGRTLNFESEHGASFGSLTHARKELGFVNKPTTATLPKSAHPHNQKGYRADSGRSK